MATTVSVQSLTRLQNAWLVTGSIALTGSYVTNGDVLSFVNAKLPISTSVLPNIVDIIEMPAVGSVATGYTYRYAVGADLSAGKLQVFATFSSTPAQFAAGAYNAGLLAAKLVFQAIIPAL